MERSESSPIPQRDSASPGGYRLAGDDIELPAMPEPTREQSSDNPRGREDSATTRWNGTLVSVMACSALIAAVAFGAWLLRPGSSSEKAHPNWERAAAAQEATLTDGAARLVRVDAAGAEQLASELLFDVNDLDAETTETVRRAVQGGDVEGATQALRDAQVVSDRGAGAVEVAADLAEDSNLASAIEQGRVRFFRMDVFDCCVEDGDVVELVVNGVPFASVPMTHAGATLSVPLAPGRNELVIRGVQDGGGGITIAFTTSRGDFYCGSLTAGEEILLGVVAP